jgi:hypothetical protein
MRRSSWLVVGMLLVSTAGAVAQTMGSPSPTPVATPQQNEAAPERVIKFLEVSFADPSSWSCPKAAASDAQNSAAGAAATSCLTCTNTAAASSEVVTRPQNSEPETLSIPTGSGMQICGEVLTVKQTDGQSTSSTAASGSSRSSIVQ